MSKCEHGLTSRECYVCMSPMREEQGGGMDKDTIIRLAQDSGLLAILEKYAHEFLDGIFDLDMCGELERFAALIAAHEREACAQLCDDIWQEDGTAMRCRDAIRSRK